MNQTITFSDDDLFEWDEEKNKINIQKHGISFNEAKLIFNDYNAIEIFDAENSTIDEERYIVIGEINTFLVVTMIYTERYNKIRIISARYATSKEKECKIKPLKLRGFTLPKVCVANLLLNCCSSLHYGTA